jgi:hypothetical protein
MAQLPQEATLGLALATGDGLDTKLLKPTSFWPRITATETAFSSSDSAGAPTPYEYWRL